MGFQLLGLALQIACLFHKMKVVQLGLKNIYNSDWISSARTMIPDPAFHNIYSLYPFVPYVFATAPQRLACPSAATAASTPTTSAPFRRLMYEVLDLLPRGASPGHQQEPSAASTASWIHLCSQQAAVHETLTLACMHAGRTSGRTSPREPAR
jgi:hypothetical protein